VFVENDHAIEVPTVTKGFKRPGAATAGFEPEHCLPKFAEKSVDFINESSNKENPFFLYVPLTSPHTPIVPNKRWKGKSGLGDYGDFVMETDWVVGQILDALDANGVTENTLVLFSTDNGASPRADMSQLAKFEHYPNGELKGMKSDIYEGGHRVPTLAVWPEVIAAGSTTDRLTSLADFYATCADITGANYTDKDGVDSISFLGALKGEEQVREPIVMHSINGMFAIRKGDWKLSFCSGSGGWSKPGRAPKTAPKWQLYNLKEDLGETNNLYSQHPEIVEELHALMVKYIEEGRSTAGEKQANDAEIILDKEGRG